MPFFVSLLYKDGTIETTKCSRKKLKRKFRGREHVLLDSEKRKEKEMVNSLELQKDKKSREITSKMQKIFLDYKKNRWQHN